jgi:hypothetical protein
MIQIPRFHFLPLPLSRSDVPDGLQQGFEATLGDCDGYGFCYRHCFFLNPKTDGLKIK